MTDPLSLVSPEFVIPLFLLGIIFGGGVMWHFPTTRLGVGPVFFTLALADLMPWLFLIISRAIEFTLYHDPKFANWAASFGTMLMFVVFDLGAVSGIWARGRLAAQHAKRDAVLPHGVHHEHQT